MNYIGIDIGDGESCVCILPASSQIEPRPIPITGRKSFLSVVAKDGQGNPVIGMDAVSLGVVEGFSVRFKSRFLRNTDGAHEDMRRFLQGVFSHMEREGLLKGEHRVTVGCPAGWKNETRSRYLEMISDAGFEKPRLVSESRAAFLYAKHARTIQLDPALIEDSALVIDIGSSTLDFAYVVNGRETNVGTFGDVYLGGGAIDEALLQAAVAESGHKSAIEKVFREAPEWRSHCLLAARRLKEEYFTRQSRGEKNIRCREMLTLMYDQPLPLPLQANDQLIWRVVNLAIDSLGGASFYRVLEKALIHAREKTAERPPRLVLLTGGASRMLFFQELCHKHFPGAHFVLCDEPEFSIAKGLAYSARIDDSIHAFNQEIEAYLKTDQIRGSVMSRMESLIEAVSGSMASLGYEEAKEHILKWCKGDYETLNDMNRRLGEAIAAKLRTPQTGEAVSAIVKNEMSEVCALLQPQIDEICRRHGVASSQMQLRSLEKLPGGAKVARLEIHGDLAVLQNTVQALITALVAGVMLLIPGGMVVDVVMVAVAAVAGFFGRDAIGSMTESIVIPKMLRGMIPPERIINEKLREKLHASFRERLTEDDAFQDGIADNIEHSIVDYVSRMAQKTEISIATGDESDE